MAVLTNILLVLNLLHHRRAVSIRMIQQECGVSRWTAYRYLTAISEANFPVVNDPFLGGFKLEYKWGKGICNFSEAEAEFLLSACTVRTGDVHQDEAFLQAVRRKLETFLIDESSVEL